MLNLGRNHLAVFVSVWVCALFVSWLTAARRKTGVTQGWKLVCRMSQRSARSGTCCPMT